MYACITDTVCTLISDVSLSLAVGWTLVACCLYRLYSGSSGKTVGRTTPTFSGVIPAPVASHFCSLKISSLKIKSLSRCFSFLYIQTRIFPHIHATNVSLCWWHRKKKPLRLMPLWHHFVTEKCNANKPECNLLSSDSHGWNDTAGGKWRAQPEARSLC